SGRNGNDNSDALAFAYSELSLPFLPDMSARDPYSTMAGRAMAVIDGLDADISVGRWRLSEGTSIDQRRSGSRLQEDLDILEEYCGQYTGEFKIQIAGPLSLAASVELPRGGLVLADRGASRELAESLAEGISGLIDQVRRRMSGAQLIVQVDEPRAPAVMAGTVATISGYATHSPVEVPRADSLLRLLTNVIHDSGATAAAHCCTSHAPVDVLTGAGFTA